MLPPPVTPTKTSINLVIARLPNHKYEASVNAGNEYYSDGLPVGLHALILKAVSDAVEDWNNRHN